MRGNPVVKICLLGVALAVVAMAVAPRVRAQVAGRTAPGDRAAMLPALPAAGQIGVSIRNVGADDVKNLKLSEQAGTVIERVEPDSPASAAGLRTDDVIVEFDGERVRSARQLTRLVLETPPGRHVRVGVMRDGRRSDLEVTPAEGRPGFEFQNDHFWRAMEGIGQLGRDMAFNFRLPLGVGMGVRPGRLGANVQELSGDLFAYFGVKNGVLVASVANDSPAAKAGLKAGDVITAVDGRSVATTAELIRALGDSNTAREVALAVVRDRKELTLKARLEAVKAPARAPLQAPV